jgi:hypothetical protein
MGCEDMLSPPASATRPAGGRARRSTGAQPPHNPGDAGCRRRRHSPRPRRSRRRRAGVRDPKRAAEAIRAEGRKWVEVGLQAPEARWLLRRVMAHEVLLSDIDARRVGAAAATPMTIAWSAASAPMVNPSQASAPLIRTRRPSCSASSATTPPGCLPSGSRLLSTRSARAAAPGAPARSTANGHAAPAS